MKPRIEWVYSKHRAALGTDGFWARIGDEKWKDTLKPRIEWVYSKHPAALGTDGFWAKISVDPSQWETVKKRIDEILDINLTTLKPVLSLGSFWARILVDDEEWKRISKLAKDPRVLFC